MIILQYLKTKNQLNFKITKFHLLFNGWIKIAMIGNIIHRFDVEFFHFLSGSGGSMIALTKNKCKLELWNNNYLPSIILEEIYFLVFAFSSDIFKIFTVTLDCKSLLNNLDCQDLVTWAYSSCNSLTWLISCSILDHDILSLPWPSLSLHISRFKNTLIAEDQMSFRIQDLLNFIIQSYNLVSKLFTSLF